MALVSLSPLSVRTSEEPDAAARMVPVVPKRPLELTVLKEPLELWERLELQERWEHWWRWVLALWVPFPVFPE